MLSGEEALELLLARLPKSHSHRKFLEVELHRTTAGKRGETRLKNRMSEFHLDEDFQFLWDIRLNIDSWKIQIDGLLVTERGVIIIESKNINGSIHFERDTGEFFRIDDQDEKTVMEDPRFQLNKQIRFLKKWLTKRKIRLSVSGIIVFTAKQCRFASKPADITICKTYQVPEYLLKILQSFPQKTPPIKLKKLTKFLLNNQTPFQRPPLCQQYYIPVEDLIPGVYCRHCKTHSMERLKRNWICSICGCRDPFAHRLAIREYFTFVDLRITNAEFRKFCKFNSRSLASRMLAELELTTSGQSKSRAYHFRH